MERIDISLNGASLRRAYALWLSLALFFGWVSIGASIPGSQASQLCLRATTGLTFLACSLPPLKTLLHGRSSSLACMACTGLSIVFRAMGALWGADALLICAGGATGVAFALFARLWFGRYRGSGSDLLIVLLLASCLANVLYEGGALGEGAAFVLSSVVPFLGLIAYAAGTVGIPTPKNPPHPRGQSSTAAAQRSFWIQTVALLLCNFASGIASYSNQGSHICVHHCFAVVGIDPADCGPAPARNPVLRFGNRHLPLHHRVFCGTANGRVATGLCAHRILADHVLLDGMVL